MKKSAPRANYQLQEQQSALELYLDALLSDVANESEASSCEIAPPQQDVPLDSDQSNEQEPGEKKPLLDEAILPSALVDLPIDSKIEIKTESKLDSASTAIPDWATRDIQVMTFVIDGVLCSAYINMLAGIIPLPSSLNYIPGQAPCLLGLHRYKHKNVKIIDLPVITNNKRVRSFFSTSDSDEKHYIILIGNGSWGFVIDRLEKMLILQQDQISWRLNRSKTDFMVATDAQYMSTLLDLDKLVEHLESC